jgi:hypothetical protein
VSVHSAPFARLLEVVLRTKGAPEAPLAFVPQPVSGRTAAELRAYVDGADQVTGRPLMAGVVEGLTAPLEAERLEHDRARPRLLEPDSEERVQRLFLDSGWTDNLPVVLPTEERVEEMLGGTSRARDDVVGRLRPALQEAWEFTVEQVAVNAVLAGARPAYLPAILALASTGLSARASSITAMSSLVAVNGPVRHELGLNAGIGALGPYGHANATIGRAYTLLSQNLQGGSAPGVGYFGSQGNPAAYVAACFAENEERSPWEPFHVSRGFRPDQSAVTVFASVRTTVFRYPVREETWASELRRALAALELGVSPVLVLDPLAAERLVAVGRLASRQELAEWVAGALTRPAGELWPTFEGQNLLRQRAALGEERWAAALDAAPDEELALVRPDEVSVLVVGGETLGTYRVFGATPVVTVGVDEWR